MTTTANEPARQASAIRGPGRGPAAEAAYPQVALLSNEAYHVMITDGDASTIASIIPVIA